MNASVAVTIFMFVLLLMPVFLSRTIYKEKTDHPIPSLWYYTLSLTLFLLSVCVLYDMYTPLHSLRKRVERLERIEIVFLQYQQSVKRHFHDHGELHKTFDCFYEPDPQVQRECLMMRKDGP